MRVTTLLQAGGVGLKLALLPLFLVLPSCATADNEPSIEQTLPEQTPLVSGSVAQDTSTLPAASVSVQGPIIIPKETPKEEAKGPSLAPYWQELRARLASDGLAGPEVDALLLSLGPRTQDPMGRKMRELYRSKFLAKPKPKKPTLTLYKGVVTAKNAQLCKDFVQAHSAAFAAADERYGVPWYVASALLFVETRLGTVLADVKENALHTLASMAVSTKIEDIPNWYDKLPGYEEHLAWFAQIMPKRADWAYKETKALISYMLANNISPDHLPGSIYGAIGLCQFMPSNINHYGADGNNDGVIDLYTVDDAVMSLARYLGKHGWKANLPRAKQHALLMRYNRSVTYANTILALGDLMRQEQTAKKASSAQ